ncbi:hypothetical protein N0V90_001024 [Kalmusia sp. IMI 367209]|nr:hypothetical protein N0V90_001024 [Kalmusia sp. IMI 367209]
MVTYLITGASRGLGRGLTEALLSQPSHTVVAAVRDPQSSTSLSLADLPRAADTQLITVKIDSTSDTDAAEAAHVLATQHGIKSLDVVVANAGFGEVWGDLTTVKPKEVGELVDVNGIEQPSRGKFVLIGTPIASISAMEKAPWPMFAYGASKTVAHYLTRKIHVESPSLTAFVVDPGFMQTDMGNNGARHFGYEQAFVPVAASVKFILGQVEEATREKVGGKFVSIDEERKEIEW